MEHKSQEAGSRILNPSLVIGRDAQLFRQDLGRLDSVVAGALQGSRVLVYGGAGSIGREVVRQLFARSPAALHVIDISENNLVEVVRDLRSTLGYLEGETRFLPLDMGSIECSAFLESQKPYDFVLNLAAMKHVRSEKDEFSLMRMVRTNVLDTLTSLRAAIHGGTKKYFAVSTDKARRPANLMGATKRIMEDLLFGDTGDTVVSTARFANVAFSDGSLLNGFIHRLQKEQPLSAPRDVRRYFISPEESGMLCLASAVLGGEREIFFPKLDADEDALTFSEIASRLVRLYGFEPFEVASEDEARSRAAELIRAGKWPCYFFDSDTTGEKPLEEFFADDDDIAWDQFEDIGVITARRLSPTDQRRAEAFIDVIESMRSSNSWRKADLVQAISNACPELEHLETGRFLDDKM